MLLEEFVSSKLEGTLEEVACEGWANTSQESASTLVLDDLTETTNETAVVGDWVELDSRLDAVGNRVSKGWERRARALRRLTYMQWDALHIDGCEATVSD